MCIREFKEQQDMEYVKKIWCTHCISADKQIWQKVQSEIRCATNETHVKIKNNSVVAFIIIRKKNAGTIDRLQNYIFELCADPTREGYGSELLKEMQNDRERLFLHVKKTNVAAIKFYETNHFQKTGEENGDGTKHVMKWERYNTPQKLGA